MQAKFIKKIIKKKKPKNVKFLQKKSKISTKKCNEVG